MEGMMDKIFDAIEFAAKAHAGQYRKGTKIPYIVHPLGVASLLAAIDSEENVRIAGLLHDTVEDTPVTLDNIRSSFGADVAEIVAGTSEPDKSDTWENRKKHTLEALGTAPVPVVLVALADKLDNVRSIAHDLDLFGDEVWMRFNRPKPQQQWYYASLARVFMGRLHEAPAKALARQYQLAVHDLFDEQRNSAQG
jgi:(p)ppGpp synthase/HD superfamily hydrolase